MTIRRVLLGVSGVTALCCAMVLVDHTAGSVLRGVFRLLLPTCRCNPA